MINHTTTQLLSLFCVGYRLYSATNGNAEGMAVVIHQDALGSGAIGGTGPNLGVYGGIQRALVIELDTGE
jgi:hypothetical protein